MRMVWATKWVVVAVVAVPFVYACASRPGADRNRSVVQDDGSRLERGKYLAGILGCGDCHTPMKMGERGPEPDMSLFLAGHPEQVGKMPPAPPPAGPWIWFGGGTNTVFAGPWGTTYAINLTPDKNTGMGIWTEEMFVRALRTGKHFGTARPIQPPMPWQAYSQMTDEDLSAVYAYLRSIPAIKNRVPEYEPPPAAGAR